MNFVQLWVPWNANSIGTKFTISCEFSPPQVKIWNHMFSSMKMEEYVESEHSGNFRGKVVAKKKDVWVSGDPFYACGG